MSKPLVSILKCPFHKNNTWYSLRCLRWTSKTKYKPFSFTTPTLYLYSHFLSFSIQKLTHFSLSLSQKPKQRNSLFSSLYLREREYQHQYQYPTLKAMAVPSITPNSSSWARAQMSHPTLSSSSSSLLNLGFTSDRKSTR